MLSAKQLTAIQKMGQKTFQVSCVVHHRTAFATDASNPYGDDTLTYDTTTTTVKGWLVPTSTVDFSVGIAQVISEGNYLLRVPSDTDVEPGDTVDILGNTYSVSESTTEQTWPEWLNVRLRRIQ